MYTLKDPNTQPGCVGHTRVGPRISIHVAGITLAKDEQPRLLRVLKASTECGVNSTVVLAVLCMVCIHEVPWYQNLAVLVVPG